MFASLNIKKQWIVIALLLALVLLLALLGSSHDPVDYNTQVKPLLNQKCISCHGGVKKQGGFSLLFREEALAATESGKPAIVPGDPGASELVKRINSEDPEERMPYEHAPLSKEEIKLLTRWIKEGVQWGDHWSYLPVKPVGIPSPEKNLLGLFSRGSKHWGSNEMDAFIFEKIKAADLEPSPEADKATILRRVAIDLTGMPASSAIGSSYLQENSSFTYEMLVDSLLASPRFGERWTSVWLDIARYADTKGYERDPYRNIWKYRDWLIRAFNEDKPYDRFLLEQIAGDMLPDASDNDYIATAFHRNTMTNDEGGTDNEEFRTAAIVDRVNTTWEALMGTSFACVQCHSHPYDPFRHEEYYQFLAFFNNTRDEDTEADYPLLRHFDSTNEKKLDDLKQWLKINATKVQADKWITLVKTWQPSINSLTADSFVNSEINDTKWLSFRNKGRARLKKIHFDGKTQMVHRYRSGLEGGILNLHLDKPDAPAMMQIRVEKTKGWKIQTFDLPRLNGVHDLYFTYTNPNLKTPNDEGLMFDWFHFAEPFPAPGAPGYADAKRWYNELLIAEVPGTPVMMENNSELKRSTHLFERGNWLVKGPEMQPGVPGVMNPFPADAPRNRMGLALWLTDLKNPLTARTMVNRLWEQVFGAGLVETLEDLGSQGADPTHRELLDYLSWKFMYEYKWSVKKLLRYMVLSATYRQDSKLSPEHNQKDPFNKLYARSSRVRLSAEQVRDQALVISGLLSEKMYGPGVKPFQPEGIWLSPYDGATWEKSKNEDQYRRAVYTYWKRTAPYPSMISFDATSRELCMPRRIRTNTPLQALVTLNDEAYVEMARHFAMRMKKEGGNEIRSQITKGYSIALNKAISENAVQVLLQLYEQAL